jgi:hypothetical protein
MKKIMLLICCLSCFEVTHALPLNLVSEIIKQDDWIVSMAASSDGKRIKIRYKINSYTQKVDTMAGYQVWSNNQWVMALGGVDNYGNYVTYFNTKYYF